MTIPLDQAPAHAGHKGLTIAIDCRPTKPEKESVWLGYLMARANYIAEHSDAYPQQVGPVIPSPCSVSLKAGRSTYKALQPTPWIAVAFPSPIVGRG